MDFHFRQFALNHDQSTMKVGTDAILLGSTANLEREGDFLEVGAGCGVISLMIAQRTSRSEILAIDIDPASVDESTFNFSKSPWSNRLSSKRISLQNLSGDSSIQFDHIFSNPPFFTGDKLSVYPSRTKSRHTVYLKHEEFLNHSIHLSKPTSLISVILPALVAPHFIDCAMDLGLYLDSEIRIRPKSNKSVNRLVLCFSKKKVATMQKELVLYDLDNNYTSSYKRLIQEFLMLD